MGENPDASHIAVLGAGSWGTALAIQIARAGHGVCLWGRDPEQLAAMAKNRENTRFLPGASFPEKLDLQAKLQLAVESADIVLLCVPSHAFPDLLQQVIACMRPETRIAWATKGFEPGSGRFLHEVVEDAVGIDKPGAVVTGPSFAREVADDVPTAVTVASRDLDFAERLAGLLHFGNFRTYTTDDIVGAELGGAVKNVLAVGTGMVDGMGLGANTRAALITRGLAEMMRLSQALGARLETLMGLAGVGDLVLTCTGDLSRNRRFGLALGSGISKQQALAEIGQVVEGVNTAEEVCRLGQKYGVELPISEQVHHIIQGIITPEQGVRNLLAREPKQEN